MFQEQEALVHVGAKVPASLAAKLAKMARESRRSKSNVIRLLLEQGTTATQRDVQLRPSERLN